MADGARTLPAELVPDADVTTVEAIAAAYGVSTDAIENSTFPDNHIVGRQLVAPDVLSDLADRIEPGMAYSTVESRLDERGIDDASACLGALGLRIEWDGLAGGTVRPRAD